MTESRDDYRIRFVMFAFACSGTVEEERIDGVCRAFLSCLDELARLKVPGACAQPGCGKPLQMTRQLAGSNAKFSWVIIAFLRPLAMDCSLTVLLVDRYRNSVSFARMYAHCSMLNVE